jgi:ectoine hydroxylase-related dioxygenase (phytanoyl-CoA dioxygenase family)
VKATSRQAAATVDPDAFERDGYAVVRSILPVEVVAGIGRFLADGEPAAVEMLRRFLRLDAGDDVCAATESALRSGKPMPKDVRDVAMGHYPLEKRLSEQLWEVTRVDGFRRLIQRLLDDEHVFMHLPPASRYVLPGSRTAGVPAHQDVSYNGHLTNFITVWVPFVPVDASCGGVIVFAGGDRNVREIAPPTGPWLGACSTAGLQPVQPHLDLGDVLVLSDWIVHESAPNHSDHTRRSIDYRFFAGGPSAKHALDLTSYEVLPPALS